MAVTSILATRANAITEDNQTRYLRVCGHRDAGTLTEAQVEIPFRDAGTLANLYVYCSANNIRADSTFTVRVNQATPTNSLSVVYGNSQTGIKEDTTNTVTIAATDEVDIQLVTSNDPSTRTLTHQSHKVEFTATSGTVTVMSAGSVTTAANFSTASTTYYSAPNGSLHVLTTNEAERHSFVVKGTLTASDLYCHVTSNGRTTDTTIRSRVDQANGNMSVVYGSGQTGGKEDTSNTDDLSSGSDYNYSITTGTGTGTLSMSLISSSLVSSAGALAELAAMYPAVDTIAAGTTQWISPNGAYWWTSTEANVSTTVRCNFTAKLMRASVVTNGGTLTLTMRKGGSSTSQEIVYSSGQTGYKEDATNTVAFTSGDTGFCYQASKDAGSAATMAWIGSTMVESAVTGTSAFSVSAPTQAASGLAVTTITGTSAFSVPNLSQSSTGQSAHTGTSAFAIQAPAQSSSGLAVTTILGESAFEVSTLTQDATGESAHTGTSAFTVPAPSQDATGTAFAEVTGTAAFAVPAPDQAATGESAHQGTSEFTIPVPTQDSSGLAITSITGEGAFTVPATSQDATGEVVHPGISGTSAFAVPAPTQEATGESAHQGSSAFAVPAPEQSASGTAAHTGEGSFAIPAATQDATGEVTHPGVTGSGAFVIPAPEQNSAGSSAHQGTGDFLIPDLSMSSVGQIEHSGTSSFTVPVMAMASTGTVTSGGIITGTSEFLILPVTTWARSTVIEPPTAQAIIIT